MWSPEILLHASLVKKEKESKKISKSVTIRFPLFFVHFSSEILLAEPCVLHYHYLSPFLCLFL